MGMVDLFLEDLPQLFFPVYQAFNYSSTPLIVFTLVFTLFMTAISVLLVVLGLKENANAQTDVFEAELADLEQRISADGPDDATSSPTHLPNANPLYNSETEGLLERIVLVETRETRLTEMLEEHARRLDALETLSR